MKPLPDTSHAPLPERTLLYRRSPLFPVVERFFSVSFPTLRAPFSVESKGCSELSHIQSLPICDLFIPTICIWGSGCSSEPSIGPLALPAHYTCSIPSSRYPRSVHVTCSDFLGKVKSPHVPFEFKDLVPPQDFGLSRRTP